jgi:hypothetical protein
LGLAVWLHSGQGLLSLDRLNERRITLKKLIVLIVMVSLLVGCETLNSALNSGPVNFVCAPTAEQQATATAMLAALDAAQTAGAIFVPALSIAKASAVLQVIRAGGCFLVAELKAAFEAVDAANLSVAKKQVALLKGSASFAVPQYAPLRKFVE